MTENTSAGISKSEEPGQQLSVAGALEGLAEVLPGRGLALLEASSGHRLNVWGP